MRYYIEDISTVPIETDIIKKSHFCLTDKSDSFHGAGVHNGLHSVFTQEPNRSPAERVRFGKEEQRHERALTFTKKGFYNKCWGQVMSLTPKL